ncbi:hypothetical protein ACTA71_007496 [Dictyostelium dimigraforme]
MLKVNFNFGGNGITQHKNVFMDKVRELENGQFDFPNDAKVIHGSEKQTLTSDPSNVDIETRNNFYSSIQGYKPLKENNNGFNGDNKFRNGKNNGRFGNNSNRFKNNGTNYSQIRTIPKL